LDLENLWVGDWVFVKSLQKKGTFEGIENGKAKIKIKDKFYLVDAINLGNTTEPKQKAFDKDLKSAEVIIDDITENIVVSNATFKNSIDLHIEKLEHNFKFDFNELSFQINECDKFIKQAINSRQNVITIIHGKGKGILKNEVKSLLEKYKDFVSVITEVNNGGALEVWLKQVK